MPRRWLAALRDGQWAAPARGSAYLRLLVIADVIFLALAVCRAHGWMLPAQPHLSTEFMGFYAAGRLVNAGMAIANYAPGMAVPAYIASNHIAPAHLAMQRALSGDPLIMNFAFFYPPVYWLICAPLARLPFYPAFLSWCGLTGWFLALVLRRLVGGRFMWPALAYTAVIENAAQGENAFLLAGLLGLGLEQLAVRPVLAGMLFGGLCIKPHFLLPVFVLLLAGRQWRALAATLLSAALLCGLAGILFGWRCWFDYFGIVVPHAAWMLRHGGFSYAIQVTPFAAARLLGGGLAVADLIQAAATGFGILAVALAATRADADTRAAVVAASFPLILSVMLDYDLVICGLAIVFLWRAVQRTGFLPWEKTAFAAMFALPLAAWCVDTMLNVPLEPLISFGIVLVLLARTMRARGGAAETLMPRAAQR